MFLNMFVQMFNRLLNYKNVSDCVECLFRNAGYSAAVLNQFKM